MRLMRPIFTLLTLVGMAAPALALDDLAGRVVDAQILPGYAALAEASTGLRAAAEADCAAQSAPLRAAYGAAFDAWIRVSHLRFGPAEVDQRAYALAFWPDARGMTPKVLAGLIAGGDPVVGDPVAFDKVSVAARGFFGLEYLLYDPGFADPGAAAYRCDLVRAIAGDIALMTRAIAADWQAGYAEAMRHPGGDGPYRSPSEAVQELFKALATGLEFTADTRLGRPLGTFDKPRPKRAEARLSGRSLRHVVLSLEATQALAMALSEGAPAVQEKLAAAYAHAFERAAILDDPIFAGVSDPQGRLKVEVLQQAVARIREIVEGELGPHLGVAAGFNAMDGD